MINLINKADCCGCTACFSICQHEAIILNEDQEGFLYPHFDKEKCIECGLCEKTCPIIHHKSEPKIGNPLIYAAINTNHKQYIESSSGGIFILLCKFILSHNGIVCGAVYDEKFNVKHSFAKTLEECKAFQGSKYVQSNIKNIYPQIKSILKTGTLVLFSGTPCQVAGLKLYLRKDYKNLLTVDLICHGVPSPQIFQDYLNFIKGDKQITTINMKSKSNNKKGTAIQVNFTNGKYIRKTLKTDLWNKLYFNQLITRPSCHKCQFTHYNRIGDMTIGDAWGIHKYHPNFHPDMMISLLFTNSPKGVELFNHIQNNLDFIQINKEESQQPQLEYPAKESPIREVFWKDYLQYGFNYIANNYIGYSPKNIISTIIKQYIKRIITYKK